MTDFRSPNQSAEFARRATSGAAWISMEMIIVQGTSLIVFGVMARLITPADFGLISICLVALQIVKSLMIDNFAYAVIRKSNAEPIEFTTAFWITIGSSVLSFLIIQGSADLLERVFEIGGLSRALRQTSIIVVLMGLGRTHECWMFRHSQFRSLVIRASAGSFIGGLVGIVLALHGLAFEALVAQQVIAFTASLIALWFVCPWTPTFHFSKTSASDILRFVLQATPGGVMSVLNQTCDTILVAYFFGPTSTGLYSVGKRLRLAMQLIAAAPINGVATPSLADAQHDPSRLRLVLYYTISAVCALCAPLFFGIFAVADDTVTILFGAKWLPAVPALEWLAVGGLMAVLMSYNDTVFVIRGRPIWTFYVSALYAVLAIISFVVLSRFGSSYIAVPFVIPYLVTLPLSVWLCCQVTTLTFSDWLSRFIPGVFSAIVMVLLVRLIADPLSFMSPILRLTISSAVGALGYVGVLAIVDNKVFWKLASIFINTLRSKLFQSTTKQPNHL
jgi:O-antigen/teichoic acid export membrane protein